MRHRRVRLFSQRFVGGVGMALTVAACALGIYIGWTLADQSNQAAEAQAELEVRLTTTTTIGPVATTAAPATTRESIPEAEQIRDDPTFEAPPVTLDEPDPIPLGEPLGRLRFPTLEAEWIVVEGVGTEELKLGPGHMPWTPLPGAEGNSVISGHRTTYGGPFHDLHLLEPGDPIYWFEGDSKRGLIYRVTETIIVAPTDVWVTEGRGEGRMLTLTTCNPIGSARERLIVFAEVEEGPLEGR